VENYFNYFTEIEEQFQRRRGGILLLSTLDWALIETWKDAGIPLDAALRGIDAAFDSYDAKPARAKTRKVNSLAYCSQEVLAAAEEMKEASTGAQKPVASEPAGMESQKVIAYLEKNAKILEKADLPEEPRRVARDVISTLYADVDRLSVGGMRLDDLERQLTIMEERMFAALLSSASTEELTQVRAEAEREIAPYRSKMIAAQIEQLHRQYQNKKLMERAKLTRLSLFYM
jgi:flagellar hook-length control protein FliK